LSILGIGKTTACCQVEGKDSVDHSLFMIWSRVSKADWGRCIPPLTEKKQNRSGLQTEVGYIEYSRFCSL